MLSTLNAQAPPFYPVFNWGDNTATYDEIADPCFISDDDLFDSERFPLTEDDARELDEMDAVNEILAELDVMETHQELYHRLQEKVRELREHPESGMEVHGISQRQMFMNTAHLKKPKKHIHYSPKPFYSMKQPQSKQR
uniref:Uncharacterized protein AlNc14C40G3415 n=1 Tax=Albugo laibachii Nc14 TaxID=890382 RepID=F0W9F6_9STRA|nr:conserved hypothetical protein [Albugo laibachii Nc14]|eukprot:CCA17770.1 conserved hypothetical protein [Albugo laibachii Nc14]